MKLKTHRIRCLNKGDRKTLKENIEAKMENSERIEEKKTFLLQSSRATGEKILVKQVRQLNEHNK